MQTGIILIAAGHKNYGCLARNLIHSIRMNSSVPVHVLYHGDAYHELPHRLITSAELPPESYTKHGKVNYIKPKTFIYDLSPFENTLFLDADIVLFDKPIDDLITDLINVEWTIQNRARVSLDEDYTQPAKRKTAYLWADITEMQELFRGNGRFLYSLHSECIWFKKTAANKEYFDLVKGIYEEPPVRPAGFAGDVADELAFGIACIMTGKTAHIEPWVPVYWWQLDGKKDGFVLHNLAEKYYGYSAGGNSHQGKQVVADNYNILAQNAAKRNEARAWSLLAKRDYLPHRKQM